MSTPDDAVIDQSFLATLQQDGVIRSTSPRFQLLTGGVSSEIYRVDDGGRTLVVKRALKKLKVKADWFADVSRNRYEAAFLRYVGTFMPESVPKILGQGDGYFVMEFLDEGFSNWKVLLKRGTCQVKHARQAGEVLGCIHAHSFGQPAIAQQFASTENFLQLRVSPYLHRIAEKHPSVAGVIAAEAERLLQPGSCLIHGDFSPKNILIAAQRLVLVDCEVAFYGDPAFDLSFLLCHLLLKGLLHAPEQKGLDGLARGFLTAYQNHRALDKGQFSELKALVGRLLTMLLLARVDGKSPVEYLNEEKQVFTRAFCLHRLQQENFDLDKLMVDWFDNL